MRRGLKRSGELRTKVEESTRERSRPDEKGIETASAVSAAVRRRARERSRPDEKGIETRLRRRSPRPVAQGALPPR